MRTVIIIFNLVKPHNLTPQKFNNSYLGCVVPMLFCRFLLLLSLFGTLFTGVTYAVVAKAPPLAAKAAGANENVASTANGVLLALNDRAGSIQAWPRLSMLADPTRALTLEDIRNRLQQFSPPASAYATLGIKNEVVWLHIPVAVAADSDGEWIIDLGYALLNHVDIYAIQRGADSVVTHLVVGNLIDLKARPIASRTPSVKFNLQAGTQYDILLRVDTIGARILPITFNKLSQFHAHALNEQMLQGFLVSLAIGLFLYSLLQWLSLRESLYLKYALLIAASATFSVHFFGIGEQYIWSGNDWLGKRLAGISSLLAASAAALFIEDVLSSDMSQRLRLAIRIVVAVLLSAAVLHLFDVIDIRVVSIVMSTFGLLPCALGFLGAIARIRRGDMVGTYFLVAWATYFSMSAVMIGMARGVLPANFWTLHSFQFGATIDMLIFLRIAVLRSTALHIAAERAAIERERLISLSQTDSLTGLRNRRGLNAKLNDALKAANAKQMVAIFVMDLDLFKPINDQYGHDVGDELLTLVARRLESSVRAVDIVARVGGDEFVVVASGIQSEMQAHDLGNKLLNALSSPFALKHHQCRVGLTVGYAMAPIDGVDGQDLLKIADAAMYAGKEHGKNCVKRATIQMLQKHTLTVLAK
jgi:diguanylate cyclase